MKRIAFLLVAAATVAGVIASTAPTSERADEEASPIFGVTMPPDTAALCPFSIFCCRAPHQRSVYGQRLTKIHASTDGWGFGHFKDGKPGDEACSGPVFPAMSL